MTSPLPITPERAKWSVVMPQPVPIMGKVLYEHMKKHNVKTVGYIGYSDSYGDLWFNDLKKQAPAVQCKIRAIGTSNLIPGMTMTAEIKVGSRNGLNEMLTPQRLILLPFILIGL